MALTCVRCCILKRTTVTKVYCLNFSFCIVHGAVYYCPTMQHCRTKATHRLPWQFQEASGGVCARQ